MKLPLSPFKKSAAAGLALAAFLAVLGSPAQAQQTLAQIEQVEASQKAAAKTLAERMAVPSKLNCVKVFGNQSFCDCVHKGLPAPLTFAEYQVILTKSKSENQYGKMTKELQQAYDQVAPLREQCVAQAHKK
ncbi:MAG: hypothetical protein IPF55_06340 [Rhodoferax sp.]|nr:hypothetical protein [Rhodoferax sp.]